MKSIVSLTSAALLATAPLSFAQSPSPSAAPAGSAKPSAASSPSASARTDVYHVHFVKAAPGKAAQMAENLKKPDTTAPMPGHTLVLRHHQGDAWDYVEIEHIGAKATVDAARPPSRPNNATSAIGITTPT